ncbi:MAG: glucosyltransferase domain-containing protein [Akkermansia sp.]|nr:glucosyltransferase domain-containing protein [Akkermansia sp.]
MMESENNKGWNNPAGRALGCFNMRDAKWLLAFFAVYMLVYASYLFSGVVHVEDLLEGKVGPEYLSNGRFVIWILRRITGGFAVIYPAAGVVSGLFISAALLLQVKLLGLNRNFQRFAYGCIYVGCTQWMGVLFFQKMCDGAALGILLSTLAVILTLSGRRWQIVLAVLCCTLGVACYHTIVLVYATLMFAWFLFRAVDNLSERPDFRCLLHGLGVCAVSCTLYFAIAATIKFFLPHDVLAGTADYQQSIVGWQSMHGVPDYCRLMWDYGVVEPFRKMFSADGKIYTYGWVAVGALSVLSWRRLGWRKAAMIAAGGITLLCIPYLSGIMLLSPIGTESRVLLAKPLALACCVGLLLCHPVCSLAYFRRVLLVVVSFVVMQSTYRVSNTAKNEQYGAATALAELRDMNARGQAAGVQAGCLDCPILLCGRLPGDYHQDSRIQQRRSSYWISSCASPFLFAHPKRRVAEFTVQSYIRSERLPRLKVASREQEAEHAQALREMPIWPADGSVRVDKGVVIIKIWEPLGD